MRKPLALALAALATPVLAPAAEFEVAGYAGYTFPFYKQTFTYNPGPVSVPIPGVTVDQNGSFALEASGGPAFAGGATFYLTGGLGLEVRYDHADVTVDTKASTYTVRVGLPAPLDPVVADLALAQGTADLKAAAPFSLNLKLRTPGSVRFYLSGGASHLGDLEFTVQQTVGLGVVKINVPGSTLNVSTIKVQGKAVTQSSWGGNLGLGLQIKIGEHAALVLEGRGFYFPKRKVEWEPVVDRPLSAIELVLLQRLQNALPAVEFEPWWAQATVGFAVRF
jgi:hypothetical protein